jgi:transposase InsO family protein
MNLFINQLIKLQDDEGNVSTIIRVLWIDPSGTDVATIELDNPKAFPVWQKAIDIEAAFDQQKACILEADPYAELCRPEDTIPGTHRRRRDEAWKIIAPIIESGEQVFFPSDRGNLVKEAIERTGSNKPTIYNALRRYWQGGQKPNALLPRFERCGGKGKERQSTNVKLGRPSLRTKLKGNPCGINVDATIRRIIVRSARLFHEQRGKTLKDAYQQMLEESFSLTLEDQNGAKVPILLPEEQRPTLRQFCYWYYKERDPKQALIAREGERRVNLVYREVLGDSTQMAPFPGALWQIDSTVADIYLVSSLDRSRIIGRPVLYLIVDVFSRLIVGFSVSLEGPSWLGASLALENATTDKVEFCQEYGITITAAQWSCQHLCKALLTDRGSEYLCDNATHLSKALNIELCHTPAYRPDWKPFVERLFRLSNDEIIHWEPGAVCKPRERGDKDYRLDAIYTLDEFRRVMIRLILFYNNYHWLSEYPMNRAMIEDHVEPYPSELWDWGIRNYGRPRKETPEIIRLNLLHQTEATVTRQGISFRSTRNISFKGQLRYTCELAMREQWFVRAGTKGSWRVPIAYDPRKGNTIYLSLDSGRRLEACHLLPASKTFSGCNLEEIMDHFVEKSFAQANAKPSQQQAKAALNAHLAQERANAKEQTEKAHQGQSQRSLIQGIRDNRKAERDYEREENAWDLTSNKLSEQPEQVIPMPTIAQPDKDDEGYVAPHRPFDKLRQPRQRRLNSET